MILIFYHYFISTYNLQNVFLFENLNYSIYSFLCVLIILLIKYLLLNKFNRLLNINYLIKVRFWFFVIILNRILLIINA